jgi:hypothetical protein
VCKLFLHAKLARLAMCKIFLHFCQKYSHNLENTLRLFHYFIIVFCKLKLFTLLQHLSYYTQMLIWEKERSL